MDETQVATELETLKENIETIKTDIAALNEGNDRKISAADLHAVLNFLGRKTSKAEIEDIIWGFVTSSDDGLRLCAGLIDGKVFTSIDEGKNWTQRDPASGNRVWAAGASSSNGNKLVIVAQDEYLYTSTDCVLLISILLTTLFVKKKN